MLPLNREVGRLIGRWLVIALAVAVLIASVVSWFFQPQPPIKVRLATTPIAMSAGVFLADLDKRFAQQGLEVEIQLYSSGKQALAAVLAGQADFATVAETPLMHAVIKDQPVTVWATLGECRGFQRMVARPDRGIGRAGDLIGKSIALPRGTSAEVYALSYLLYHGIEPSQVNFVDRSPDEAAHALIAGEVDAVSLWEPYISRIESVIPGHVALRQDALCQFSWNLVGHRDNATARLAIVPMLRSLISVYAELYRLDSRQLDLLSQRCQTTPAALTEALNASLFRIQLNTDLAVTLEAEASLLYGKASRTRAFADVIDPLPLRSVDPTVVGVDW